jgi:hypothetical protein
LPLSSLQAKSTGVDLPVMVCLGGFFQAKYNQPSIISVRPGPTEFWRTRPGPRTCILQTRPRLEYSHVGIWLPPHPRSQFYDFVRPPPDLIHRARRTAAGLRSSSVTLGSRIRHEQRTMAEDTSRAKRGVSSHGAFKNNDLALAEVRRVSTPEAAFTWSRRLALNGDRRVGHMQTRRSWA